LSANGVDDIRRFRDSLAQDISVQDVSGHDASAQDVSAQDVSAQDVSAQDVSAHGRFGVRTFQRSLRILRKKVVMLKVGNQLPIFQLQSN
jgi:hypothetical protein